MDRRGFFKLTIGGVAATAAVRTWPFRVYSFPTNIVIADDNFPESFIAMLSEAMRMPRKRGPWVGNDISAGMQPWLVGTPKE